MTKTGNKVTLPKKGQEVCEGKYGTDLEKSIKLLIQCGEVFDGERLLSVENCNIPNGDLYD
jgi:predicted aconitase